MIKISTAVLRTLLFLFAISLSGMTYAGGGVSVTASNEKNVAIISLAKLEAKQVRLSVEDATENITYFSAFVENASDYKKAFDFSLLKDGDYVVVVNNNGELIKQPIQIVDSKILVTEESVTVKPVFKRVNDNLLVYFNNEDESNLLVSIVGKDGVVYTEECKDKFFKRKYNLSNLPNGKYNVTVFNNNQEFNYSLNY